MCSVCREGGRELRREGSGKERARFGFCREEILIGTVALVGPKKL